jgi:hypothetical protein
MSIVEIVDLEIMTRLSQFGTIKGIDNFALHMLKTSDEPLMRFRRDWMRREALKQHLEAEKRQNKMNSVFKGTSFDRKANMRQEAVIDHHLAAEMRHYNNAELKELKPAIKSEAPAIFPKRE